MPTNPSQPSAVYALPQKPQPVCRPEDFPFAAVGLDHGHIWEQCRGLVRAGAAARWVYDDDPAKVDTFLQAFPGSRAARSKDEILDDPTVRLVASASVPSERGALGLRVLDAGKDFFVDKAPFTSLAQLAEARAKVAATDKHWAVFYSERLHSECALFAGELVARGAIGRVAQVLGLGPHRLNATSRPAWFFEKQKTGGILCDLGSHQCEQFLFFTGAQRAEVLHARTATLLPSNQAGFEDFGEASLRADNGASGYFRVDWLSSEGLSTWGDGRTFILGTEGTIELRKNVDVAADKAGDHLILVNADGEQHFRLAGQIGHPYFGQLIRDCLDGTSHAMNQEHAFRAAELSLLAQTIADGNRPVG